MNSGALKMVFALAILAVFPLLGAGCGSKEDDLNCPGLPADQSKTLMGRLKSLPQKLVMDERFTGEEQNAIVRAARTWNELSNRLIGTDAFDVSVGNVSSMSQASGCGFNHVPDGMIAIFQEQSMERWNSFHLSGTNPATTINCSDGKRINQEGIMINTRIAHEAQFTSIALHELGHALGLAHSCAGGNEKASSGFVSCGGLASDNPYVQAVMFPTLGITQATNDYETKENLRANDVLRASCVIKN